MEKRRWLPKRVSLYSPPTTKRLSRPAIFPLCVASKRSSQKSWSCVMSVWSRAMLAGGTKVALSELRNMRFDWLAENSLRHDQPPSSCPVRRARSQ
ncbi:hypothetical protein D9M68_656180 [compost metagenome]